ncbi:MAG: hypothetical protein GY716_19870 [bacterium]|nr:hypothetical protein [bacterium]
MADSGDRHDPFVDLLPWYAAGTLPEQDRRAVDAHLEQCASCRELVQADRTMARLPAEDLTSDADEHVSPALLTHYAEDPDSLGQETRSWVANRLARCEICREAFEHLCEIGEELAAAEEPRVVARPVVERSPGLWERLRMTLLHPVPALAYLALALAFSALWLLGDRPAGPVAPARVVLVPGDRAVRAEGDGEATPLRVELPRAGEPVVLQLATELSEADLADDATSYALEMHRGAEPVWSVARTGVEFRWSDGRAVLDVVVDPGAVEAGIEYRIVVRAVRPGDPIDGEALFGRSFYFDAR